MESDGESDTDGDVDMDGYKDAKQMFETKVLLVLAAWYNMKV